MRSGKGKRKPYLPPLSAFTSREKAGMFREYVKHIPAERRREMMRQFIMWRLLGISDDYGAEVWLRYQEELAKLQRG